MGKLVIFPPYGLYQNNTGVKVREMSWVIQFIGTDIYVWGSLPTTTHIENSYISELTWMYKILSLLVSVCWIHQIYMEAVDIGCDN